MRYKQVITLSAVGVLAYVIADIFHEVLGHGGACLMVGQRIDLITSVYFKSSPGSVLTDIAGPISNLILGLLLYFFLQNRKDISAFLAFLLFTIMSYNLCWFSGTLLQSGFSKTGDWTYLIQQLDMGAFGKPALVMTGISAYFFSIKLIRVILNNTRLHFPEFPLRQSIFYSYFAAVFASVIAALFFKYDRMHPALEGLLEMTASVPLLFIAAKEKRKFTDHKMRPYFFFNITVFILFIIFCFTLGKGIR